MATDVKNTFERELVVKQGDVQTKWKWNNPNKLKDGELNGAEEPKMIQFSDLSLVIIKNFILPQGFFIDKKSFEVWQPTEQVGEILTIEYKNKLIPLPL